jgi:hypothetical protein
MEPKRAIPMIQKSVDRRRQMAEQARVISLLTMYGDEVEVGSL